MKGHRRGYVSNSDVDEALGYLSSDVPYLDWLRVAMAIKAGLGEPGYAVLDSWSQGAQNYNEAQNRVIYRGIKPGKVGIGTLFFLAKQRGWEPKNGAKKLLDSEISIDLDALQRNAKATTPQQQAELDKSKAARTARQARQIINAAALATDANPYLYRKRVKATDGMWEMCIEDIAGILKYTPKAKDEPLTGRVLVLPVGRNGRLTTCELIDGKGRKTALPGPGTKRGAYWLTRPLPDGPGEDLTVLFGEGVATTCSACSGAPNELGVAVLTIGNFKPVIEAFQARYPRAKLILLADIKKEPGIVPEAKAVEVARETGALLATPQFRSERDPVKAKDFNDLFVLDGAEAVQASIAAAERVEPLAPKLSRVERRTAQREPLLETYYGRAFPLLAVDEIRNRVQAALLSIIEEARKLAAVNARSEHKAYGPVLVLRLPTGIGKTMQMMRTLVEQGVRAAWYVPNHKLSAQSAKDFHRQAGTPPETWNSVKVDLDLEGVPPFEVETLDYTGPPETEPAARTLYGRQAEIDERRACRRDKNLHKALKDKGLLPHASLILCGRKVVDEDGKKKFAACPHHDFCRFHVQMETQAKVRILAHSYLFETSKVGSVALDKAQIVVIDESPFGAGFSHHTWSDSSHGEKLGKWLKHDFLVPVAESVLHGRVLSDDERAELLKKTKEAIEEIMETIPEEKTPDTLDSLLLETIEKFKPPRQGELGMLVAAKHWLMGETNVLYREDFGPDSFALSSSLLRRPVALDDFTGHIVVLDATANENHYRQLFPGREINFVGFDALPDPNVIWVQPTEGTFYRRLFDTQATNPAARKRAIEELERIQQNLLGWQRMGAKPGLVSYERVTSALKPLELDGIPMAHFGAVVGLNHLENCNVGFGVGRTEPSARDCERMARALYPTATDIQWNQEIEEFSFSGHLVDGTPYSEPHRAMRDPRVHSCLRMIREEASLIQGIEGRLRIFTPQEYPRVVVQLCALSRRERRPHVRAPAEAIVGTRRMAMVLAAFDGVAPLEPGLLIKNCPDQFETLTAAERWARDDAKRETDRMSQFWLKVPFPSKNTFIRERYFHPNSEVNQNTSPISCNVPILMCYYRVEGQAGKPKKALTNVHDMMLIIRQLEAIHGGRIVAIGLAAERLTPLPLESESITCAATAPAATAAPRPESDGFEGDEVANEVEGVENDAPACGQKSAPCVEIYAPCAENYAPPAAFSARKSAAERNAEQLAERLAAGTGNREIARATGMSEGTVRTARAAWLASRPNCIEYGPPSPRPSTRKPAMPTATVEPLDLTSLTDLARAVWQYIKLAPAGLTLDELRTRLKVDGAAVASAVAELAGRQVVTRTREKVVRR